MSCLARVPKLDAGRVSMLAAHGITLAAIVPLGASVRGLDLRRRDISEDVLDALQSEMADRGFLVFKDQGEYTGDEQVRASELWGGRKIHSTHGVHPEAPNKHVFRLSNDRNTGILGVGPQWHNDGSFTEGTFSHVGYHIIRVAERGGGTFFSHQGAAFDALPPEMQERWERMSSVNSNSGVMHPLVHEHPISGRKSVWLHLGMTGAVIEVLPSAPKPEDRVRTLGDKEMHDLFHKRVTLPHRGLESIGKQNREITSRGRPAAPDEITPVPKRIGHGALA